MTSQIYEIIFAIKRQEYSHHLNNQPITVPAYSVRRSQIVSDNKQTARNQAQRIQSNSIDDHLTQSQILSISATLNLEVPPYKPF